MLVLLSTAALAHEYLEEPIARYESDGFSANKSCPCGVGTNDQLCSDSSALSDPNRSYDRVTTYNAGDTITVKVHEVIGHAGRWRIAFDPDGADLGDFNANILLDVEDPAGSDGNVGLGDLWQWDVTLPDTPCDNCTLQVLQVMNGDTVDPVPDPTGQSTYFQCADLILLGTADTADTAVTSTTTTGTTTTPTGTTPTTGTDTTPTTPTGTTTGSSDSGAADTGADDEGKGCGCDGSGAPIGLAWALAALAFRRRR